MDLSDLEAYAQKIIDGAELSDDDLRELLLISDPEELDQLYTVAAAVRDHFFGNKVFLYSFVYFSTYCKNKCAFCYYNRCNDIHRYRLSLEDIRKICRSIKDEGVHMIDLTMGEDPYYHNHPERLVEMVRAVKEDTGMPIMISPGVVSNETLEQLKQNGANFLALYQETYDRELYKRLRVEQSFRERINCRSYAGQIGYCTEDGMLTGVEPDIDSTITSLRGMQAANTDMVRVMTFIPQKGTPLETNEFFNCSRELQIISILRLLFPKKLIPASLDLEGIDGMVDRLNAGANVVTSIISSDSSLEGVVNYDREHSERNRDVASVVERLATMGMEPASQEAFEQVIGGR